MERVAEADQPEPSSGVEQRGADPQPPVFSQHQLTVCQLHAALRQREQLAAFQAARERGISWRAVDAQRAAFGVNLALDAAALRASRRSRGPIPPAITQQGSAAVLYMQSYLLSRQLSVVHVAEAQGEDVLR